MTDRDSLQNFLQTRLAWPAGVEKYLLLASKPAILEPEISILDYMEAIKKTGEMAINKVLLVVKQEIPREHLEGNLKYVDYARDILSALHDFRKVSDRVITEDKTDFSPIDKIILGKALNVFMRFMKEKLKFHSKPHQLDEETIAMHWQAFCVEELVRDLMKERGFNKKVVTNDDPEYVAICDEAERVITYERPELDPEMRGRVIEALVAINEIIAKRKTFCEAVINEIGKLVKDTGLNLGEGLERGWW